MKVLDIREHSPHLPPLDLASSDAILLTLEQHARMASMKMLNGGDYLQHIEQAHPDIEFLTPSSSKKVRALLEFFSASQEPEPEPEPEPRRFHCRCVSDDYVDVWPCGMWVANAGGESSGVCARDRVRINNVGGYFHTGEESACHVLLTDSQVAELMA